MRQWLAWHVVRGGEDLYIVHVMQIRVHTVYVYTSGETCTCIHCTCGEGTCMWERRWYVGEME